jgi:F-type H+-transporting ATPase subunit a
MAFSAFEQFEIIRLIPIHLFGNFDISFTNSSLYMLLSVGFFYLIYKAVIENSRLVPGR